MKHYRQLPRVCQRTLGHLIHGDLCHIDDLADRLGLACASPILQRLAHAGFIIITDRYIQITPQAEQITGFVPPATPFTEDEQVMARVICSYTPAEFAIDFQDRLTYNDTPYGTRQVFYQGTLIGQVITTITGTHYHTRQPVDLADCLQGWASGEAAALNLLAMYYREVLQ